MVKLVSPRFIMVSGGKQRYFKHYKKEKTLDMCHMNVDKPNSLIYSCRVIKTFLLPSDFQHSNGAFSQTVKIILKMANSPPHVTFVFKVFLIG